jgi:hypothetical protein
MISQLAGPQHMTDWGMRIISNKSPIYSGAGYHFGSVWPLFTGWAAVGEYRYHREQPAYANLRANALLALDGSPGHVTEVLSGDYYQTLSTASPHQIWSAAMVISPVLRGMLGLDTDVARQTVTFVPHLPANWTSVAVKDIRAGDATVGVKYTRTETVLTFEAIQSSGRNPVFIEFRPAISLRARVMKAELDGKPFAYKVEPTENDQHVAFRIPLRGERVILRVTVANDFAVDISSNLPQLGKESEGLRMLSETWSATKDRLDLEVSGTAGQTYELDVRNSGQIANIEGAALVPATQGEGSHISVTIPGSFEGYSYSHIAIQFKTR